MWLMLIDVRTDSGRRFTVPLPLFLLWILIAPFLLIAMLAALLVRPGKAKFWWAILVTVRRIGGMQIEVRPHATPTLVSVRFI
jgi:hypothetical protein